MSRFQFVADNSTTFEVKRLCELVEVERSSYYAWKAGAPARAARAAADAELVERIRAVHKEDNTCGAPRITAELNDGAPAGERVNHKRVARVMRENSIAGYVKKRRVRTTIPEPADQVVPDLLKRDFTAEAPGLRYVGDITYLPLADGTNLYLATVIDCYSRRLAGWAIADHMRTSLVEEALKAAAATRGSLAGAHLPLRPRVGLHEQGLRQALQGARRHPVHGRRGNERRQRARRVVQRHHEARGPPRRRLLGRRADLPSPGLPMARPLQHPPQTLLVRLPVPVHLRGPPGRYTANRCVINPCVQVPGVGPPGTPDPDPSQDGTGGQGVVALPGGRHPGQWPAAGIGSDVDLRAQPAAGTAQVLPVLMDGVGPRLLVIRPGPLCGHRAW